MNKFPVLPVLLALILCLSACQSGITTTTPSDIVSTPTTTELPQEVMSALSIWSDNKTPVAIGTLPPTKIEGPEDFVPTPGGGTYRANYKESGVVNPWPPIEVVRAQLNNDSNIMIVDYRKSIEARAGEMHLDIIMVWKLDAHSSISNLSLYTIGLPKGMIIFNGGNAGSGTSSGARLYVITPQDFIPGQYNFQIGIFVDNKDYGTVPCTINVSGWDNS